MVVTTLTVGGCSDSALVKTTTRTSDGGLWLGQPAAPLAEGAQAFSFSVFFVVVSILGFRRGWRRGIQSASTAGLPFSFALASWTVSFPVSEEFRTASATCNLRTFAHPIHRPPTDELWFLTRYALKVVRAHPKVCPVFKVRRGWNGTLYQSSGPSIRAKRTADARRDPTESLRFQEIS